VRTGDTDALARTRSHGFSLVELMVSIALGLVLLSSLVALFVDTSRTSREMARASSMIESGRFAIQVLENDLIHAGFWGTHVPAFDDLTLKSAPDPAQTPDAVLPACLTYDETTWAGQQKNLVGIAVQAYGTVPAECGPAAGPVLNARADSDVLVVRHAETCKPGEGNCAADAAGEMYFQASRCASDPAAYTLATGALTLRAKDCATVAEKRRLVSNVYYVRSYSVSPADGVPTLVRSPFGLKGGVLGNQAPDALVEGVEAIRVELGIDSLSETGAPVDYSAAVLWQDPDGKTIAVNRGDGVPDGEWARCGAGCAPGQLVNATVARIYVLARARERTPGHRDLKTYQLGSAPSVCSTASVDVACASRTLDPEYKRHVFSATVRLVNVAGRRETPS